MVKMSRLEKQRLAALKRLYILDTEPDSKLDRMTPLARQVLHTDIALISILDERRQ